MYIYIFSSFSVVSYKHESCIIYVPVIKPVINCEDVNLTFLLLYKTKGKRMNILLSIFSHGFCGSEMLEPQLPLYIAYLFSIN